MDSLVFIYWIVLVTSLKVELAHSANGGANRTRCHAEYGIRFEASGVRRVLDSVRCSNTDRDDVVRFLISHAVNQTIDLEITNTSIRSLDREFLSGFSIRRLRMNKCRIASVSQDSFQGLTDVLEELDLSNNELSTFPSAVRNLTMLRVLYLKRNRIETLAEGTVFFNLHRLTHLDLSYNRLGYLDTVSKESNNKTGIPWLLLSVFNLEPLRGNLEILSLRSNGMSSFPEQFLRPFSRLRHLDLSANNFSVIPYEAFSQMGELEHLNLQSNFIREFRLSSLPAVLQSLSLAENPLNCDCSMMWLWNLIHKNNSQLEVTLSKCHEPEVFRNQEIEKIVKFCSNSSTVPVSQVHFSVQYVASKHSVVVVIRSDKSEWNGTTTIDWSTTIRKFATLETQNFSESSSILYNESIFYTVNDLEPATGYIACTVISGLGANSTVCEEITTLEEEGFPTAEVAVAASVSTSTTIFVAVLVCCCCPKRSCCRKQDSKAVQNGALANGFSNHSQAGKPTGGAVKSLSDKYSHMNETRGGANFAMRRHLTGDDEESARVFQATCEYLRRRNQELATGTLKKPQKDGPVVARDLSYRDYLQPIGSEELKNRGTFYLNATYEVKDELDALNQGQMPRRSHQKYYTWATRPVAWTTQHYENYLANSPAFKYKHRKSISQLSIPFCSMPPIPSGNSQQFYWSAAPAPSSMNLQF